MRARARSEMQARVVRRRRPSPLARVLPFWAVGACVLAVLGVAAWFLTFSSCFRLTRVAVEIPLGSRVTALQVRDAAAIAPDANVWLIDTRAVQQRIEAIPYVDRASVRRAQFPHPAVELAVTVRRPADCLRGDGGTVTVDAAARVLQRGCAVPAAPLVVASAALPAPGQTVSDASVTRLLRDEAILVQAGLGLRRIARDRWAGLEIVDRSGVTVRFGDDADLPHKAALVGPVRAGIGTRRPVAAIDLRAPATPIVEFR